MFNNLSQEGLEKQEDRLGGSFILPSDIYETKIKMFYGIESKGGAMGVELILDVDGKEYSETIYVTSGKEKGQKNYFEKGGKKYPMPGFTTINDIVLVSTGKELKDLEFEDRTVEAWDSDAGKKINKVVQAAPELFGVDLLVAIQQVKENKQKKNDATGQYEDVPGETRDTNSIVKVFAADKRTVRETLDEDEEPTFHDAWLTKNKDVVYDKTAKSGGRNDAAAGGPPKAAGGGNAPAKSGAALFGRK